MKNRPCTQIQTTLGGVRMVLTKNQDGKVQRTLYLNDLDLDFSEWRKQFKSEIDRITKEASQILTIS